MLEKKLERNMRRDMLVLSAHVSHKARGTVTASHPLVLPTPTAQHPLLSTAPTLGTARPNAVCRFTQIHGPHDERVMDKLEMLCSTNTRRAAIGVHLHLANAGCSKVVHNGEVG